MHDIRSGLGTWWPGTALFLARVRKRVPQVVTRTERWEGGIDYSVHVNDPDMEKAGDPEVRQRRVWYDRIEFGAGEQTPSERVVAVAREQERIAREIWQRYGTNAVD
jgi:hypothetical protein